MILRFSFVKRNKRQAELDHRKQAEKAGRIAEKLVLAMYIFKGYWPQSYRLKKVTGEVDLVMRKGNQIICVEVKYRQSMMYEGYGLPSKAQIKRLRQTMALIYSSYPASLLIEIQLDVVVIYGWRKWKIYQNC